MIKRKSAIITGGTSGIGYATAQRFIRGGYDVIITGRNQNKLEMASKELGEHSIPFLLDMADPEKIPTFVLKVHEMMGSIDVLVNNAGINLKKDFTEVTDQDFEAIIRINQSSVFALSREVVRVMLNQETKGAIIHISSMAAYYGIPKVIAYTASKSAIEGMTRSMAVDLSPKGIRVNAVVPGYIRTPMTDRALDHDHERKSRVLQKTPMGRLGEPVEVANAIFFLASEEASFITGHALRVDGGNSIGF
ncbi:MAG TPA: SDR family oxidoreductase [Saprospiraceae bacterium]|nr:SDR family oxidoreductase [Saprospiraceae bacterium]